MDESGRSARPDANRRKGKAMSWVTKEESWAKLVIDTTTGTIMVLERWKYNFTSGPGLKDWTSGERIRFHRSVKAQISRGWNRKVKLKTSGAAPFAHKFKTAGVAFIVRRVWKDQHWTVDVRKMPAGSTPTSFISNVDRPHLRINLDSADLASYTPTNAAGASHTFLAVPHEFGHTFPDVDDEYNAPDAPPLTLEGMIDFAAQVAHLLDTNSIMNIGNEIRGRHLEPILDSLNTMIPDCKFAF
jgi:hypothetical protein